MKFPIRKSNKGEKIRLVNTFPGMRRERAQGMAINRARKSQKVFLYDFLLEVGNVEKPKCHSRLRVEVVLQCEAH